jgi:integrase
MARPSYLSRRDGGRYYLQLRLPRSAFALYGRSILRASLRTGEFGEARRRLMDNLAWARELIDAPDLEALGAVIHGRLQGYTAAGAPDNERALAERVGFEHQARHYMARANERGYAFPQRFERFATKWVDFVDQNKAAEVELGRLDRQHDYERGRAEATKLLRASITTVKGYQGKMSKFVAWAIKENLYHGKAPKFECIDENNLAALPRDAFDDAELIKLISLPLFTGCANAFRVFKPGKYFLQTHIYWGYLILILTGMRPGEVGQLKCADLVSDGDNFFFDLRPYNARNGRVAIKDLRNLKTNSSGRIVPIHPLLIDLGLLDRMRELMAAGEERLFPEWEVYKRPDGGLRWSQPMSKSWRYVKTLLKISRADLTLYSTRHLMGDWLDAAGVAQRTRDRILGHASAVPGRYGRKSKIDPEQIAAIEKLEPGVVKTMREILMAAKEKAGRGELTVLKPWIKALR